MCLRKEELTLGGAGGGKRMLDVVDQIDSQAWFAVSESMLAEGTNSGWLAFQEYAVEIHLCRINLIPGEPLAEFFFARSIPSSVKPKILSSLARVLIQKEMVIVNNIFGDWLRASTPYAESARDAIQECLLDIFVRPLYEITKEGDGRRRRY